MMKVSFSPTIGVKKGYNLAKKSFFKEQKPDEFTTKTKENEEKKSFKTKAKELFGRFKTAILVIGSSVLTGLTVFGITQKKNADIRKKNEELQNQIDNIVLPEDLKGKVGEKIQEIEQTDLPYSATTRIEVKEHGWSEDTNTNPVSILPKTYEKTTLRSDAETLIYPEFQEGKPYHFEFPQSNEIKTSHNSAPVKSQPRTLTTVSESYADSLLWNNDKIARDLMQNFYDGHGQTLDGVKFNVEPTEDGKYKVKISGDSSFTADKAILLGESSKKNDDRAAGNYGEGLKMVVLKLLREKGADEVNIASNNWKVNWNFEDSELGKKVLAYKLDEVEAINGNYIEFNTDDTEFIKSIINSFDKFYHYNNPAFKCPDFENDLFGIKLVDEKESGKFYIAGQAFEVDGDYEGLNEMNIYIKKKPPVRHNGSLIFDPSRDRTSLTRDNLESLGQWIVSSENMSKEDAVKLVHSLEKYWDVGCMSSAFKHNTKGTAFISGLYYGLSRRYDLNIKFDSKNVSDSIFVSHPLKQQYEQAGYRICSPYFKNMGMKSIEELVKETRKHKPVDPTPSEKNKILILKDAIKLLAPVLKENDLFSNEELDTKIFLYDRNAANEDASYKNVTGEAIIDRGVSLGFWLDKTALKEESFSSMLSTSLHELTHKFGGDESENFSYKLTDVLEKVFAAINNNPNLAIQLKVLEEAWKAQS